MPTCTAGVARPAEARRRVFTGSPPVTCSSLGSSVIVIGASPWPKICTKTGPKGGGPELAVPDVLRRPAVDDRVQAADVEAAAVGLGGQQRVDHGGHQE